MTGRIGIVAVAGLAGISLLLGRLEARSSGVLPNEFLVPPNVSSAFPSCGACHGAAPNANGKMAVAIGASALSVAAGATVNVDVGVTGGPGKNLAGFSMETSTGAFVPARGTRALANGSAITHVNKFGNSWKFTWKAPATPGLVRWTTAGNSVNADNGTFGDSWGFWGPNSSVPGVPFRLFVNAPKVDAFGTGCAGSDGHVPILGAASAATVGQVFRVECHNAPPLTAVLHALGISDKLFGGVIPLPFDLGLIGAPGCFLRCDHLALAPIPTTGSGSGGGVSIAPWPIPNDPNLKGFVLFFQGLVVDLGANKLGITATNGIKATLQ